MGLRRSIPIVSFAFSFVVMLVSVRGAAQVGQEFEQKIWPNLRARCGSCHSGATPAAGLNLTTREGLMKGGVSGGLLNPSNPDQSTLLIRLRGAAGKPQMPMGFAPLLDSEILAIRNWIAAGAPIAEASAKPWAFLPPKRVPIPSVRNKKWPKNPIDAFVLAKLESEGLSPSPEASKETLIRRVSLDLIGLPPTPEEVDAFLHDNSANAYEKLVDRLLASPHYGEHQARGWLDLARYADSNGYEKDGARSIWPYRDWVIRAFNSNMPYDQFSIEQIAGDLLPNPTIDQLVATGFNRNTMKNEEGGVDQEEALFEVEIDRVVTTSTVWLGLTMGCARCHDHKYDPLTMKDFYSMMAYFASPDVAKLGDASISEQKYTEPSIEVPTEEQAALKAKLTNRGAALQKELSEKSRDLGAEQKSWETAIRNTIRWNVCKSVIARADSGAKFERTDDSALYVSGPNPEKDRYLLRCEVPGKKVAAIQIEPVPDRSFVNNGPGRSDSGNFVLSKVRVLNNGKEIRFRPVADFVQNGYDINGVADDNPETGWAVYGDVAKPHRMVLEFEKPIIASSLEIVLEFQSIWQRHAFGKFRMSFTADSFARASAAPSEIAKLVNKADRNAQEAKTVSDYFLSVAPSLDSVRKELSLVNGELMKLNASIPRTLVMRDEPGVKSFAANIHNRGEFLSKGEVVSASTPVSLTTGNTSGVNNRLALAKWLLSKDNPLTARVQINRMWEQLFGRGIVETSENLGTQSSSPSHPELLDWLATEFMNRNWDMKAMIKLIVMSSTYKQSSAASERLMQLDPQNALLARGPRFRMDAEVIRDAALKISGLLSKKMYGPPVFPYQPEGVWNSPFNGEKWVLSDGEDKYRRGIYTYAKRTAPYPMFTTFDGGSRESCLVRRIRTNTPLQSLTLMNDATFVDAGKALGERMAEYKSRDLEGKIAYGFRLCTSRMPTKAEAKRLADFYLQMKREYAANPDESSKFAGSSEKSAWAILGNLLLNLDETLTNG